MGHPLLLLLGFALGWYFEAVTAQSTRQEWLFIASTQGWLSSTSPAKSLTDKEILDSLFDGYDNSIRPGNLLNGTVQPVRVAANMLIRSIEKIDDINMDYTAQVTFRMMWRDQRLAYNDGGSVEYVNVVHWDRMWKPDIFFQNEKSARLHNILGPNLLIRVYPSGDVLFSIRTTLTLGCPMNLRFFPMDHQACLIRMASYAFTTKDIELVWDSSKVQTAKELQMPRFRLALVTTGDCSSHTTTGWYACLKATFLFDREFSYYLHHIFLPTAMLVMLSWLPAWMDPEVPTARILIGVASVLSLLGYQYAISAMLPPVAYLKAIDVWNGMCLQLAFAALVGSVLVNYLGYADRSKWLQGKLKHDKSGDPIEINGFPSDMEPPVYVPSPRIAKMDAGARIGLPVIFLIFNLIFWLVILTNNHRPAN